MRATRLGELCQFENGDRGQNYPGKSSLLGEGIPFVSAGDLEDGRVKQHGLSYISPEHFSRLSNGKFKEGDFLFCLRGSLGKFAHVDRELSGAIASSLVILRPGKELEPGYLKSFLGSTNCKQQIEAYSNGAAQPNLAAASLKRFEIPLPPLPEQRRIAAILDKADAQRRKRKRAIELLDSLTQSIFLEMFGNLDSNSKNWPAVRFGELVSIDAPLVDPQRPEFSELLHFGPDRIEKNTGKLLPAQTAHQDGLISSKFLCNKNHILYSKIRPYLNKVALCDGNILCSADIYPVSTDESRVDRVFIWYLLRSKAFLKYADTCSNRANIPKINRGQFLAFQCPLPPLSLQKRFSSLIARGDRTETYLSASNTAAFDLFTSLQHRAFSGQL